MRICNLTGYPRLNFVYFPVVSNDDMYGHDKKFIAEVYKIISTVVEEVLKYLQALSGAEVGFNCTHVM